MPRAKTGCTYVLYTLVTKDALLKLQKLVDRAPDGIGRPLVVDALIKRAFRQKLPKIEVPIYKPHAKIKRKILKSVITA